MRYGFIFLVSLLAACSPTALVTPYKIDVQQGNVVTDEMLSKVKPGMTKAQVRFALGTPLIADPFHADRWDYVYRMRKDGELVEHARLTVVFEDDKLTTTEGTVLPPSNNVAGTIRPAPLAVPALALAPVQPHPTTPPLLDLKQVESDLGAAPQTPAPAAESAKPATGEGQVEQSNQAPAEQPKQAQAVQPDQAQAEPPKRSFGERFIRLFGFGKKDEESQTEAQKKPEAQPESQPDQRQAEQTKQVQAEQPDEAQAEPPKRSFGQRFLRLFGFGKEDETQQAKAEEKSEAQPKPLPEQQAEAQKKPDAQPELQQEDAEPATNTVVTADREPPPKRTVGERFMRLIGFRSNETNADPAPPVHTEVNTSVPRFSSLTFKQAVRQILGLEDAKDREQKEAAGDIEPGEKVNTEAKGTTWQRFKRLIGAGSDEPEPVFTPANQQQQTTQAGTDAKPDAVKSDATKP